MKSFISNTTNERNTLRGINYFHSFQGLSKNEKNSSQSEVKTTSNFSREQILTSNAIFQMATGQVPDLWEVCLNLYNTLKACTAPLSAIQFVPVLEQIYSLDQQQVKRFLKNREHRHVLIDHELLKVVLIHWKPGTVSAIHGHPKGGCIFKILQGKLEELRFTPTHSPKLLSTSSYKTGAMTYIDDRIGYHQVGNPYGISVISLHVYTPGK
ncbi:cysteine dioxygenase [Sunxiuqinia sp. A32]|uniref:cysteine dioxygenase n=1 Tax=Sunxiuqinia sp. A32 TaxID=3461496 RepID=UPI0040464402